MKQATRVGWLLVIVTLICFGLEFQDMIHPTVADPAELYNIPWVDHIPKGDYEPMRAYVFLERRDRTEEPNGGYLLAESSYKAHAELFKQEVTGTEIRFTFLHDKVKAVTGYKLQHQAPDADDLDLKLTLLRDPRFGGRTSVFYSSTSWQNHHWPGFVADKLLLPQ